MVTVAGNVVSPYTSSEIWKRKYDNKTFKFNMHDSEGPEGKARYLVRTGGLKNEYLGVCLDEIRWGSQTTVMYEKSTLGMIDYILEWIKLNQGNLLWHEKQVPVNFTLPYIKHDLCPRNEKHEEVFRDIGGRVKCAHREIKRFKPSYLTSYDFFDDLSQTKRTEFFEQSPQEELLFDEDDIKAHGKKRIRELELKHEQELLEYEKEEATEEVLDVCGAILSDVGTILPLEELLNRLNLQKTGPRVYCAKNGYVLESFYTDIRRSKCKIDKQEPWEPEPFIDECQGHDLPPHETVHDFDGYYLAWMVQKWYEQVPEGKSPVYRSKPEEIARIKELSKAKHLNQISPRLLGAF